MKEIIYNYDNLEENDINSVVVRTKALIINEGNILIGNENNIYQFPGGHQEDNETLYECLKREVEEETGIEISPDEVKGPFMKITYLNKDYKKKGENRKSEIYYYSIETDKKPNLNNTNYTEEEKKNNFKIEVFPLNESIKLIKENVKNNIKNEIISVTMIEAIKEYLNIK